MEKKNNLHAIFSKRCNDLFMKANQLCTLNGAELALLVFSPGKKAYAFGHSSFEFVTDKFLGNKSSTSIHGGTYHHMIQEGQHKNWWQEPIEEMNLEQLLKLKKALKGLKKKVEDEVKRRI
nr:agamous-like MADS-box protein AGL62 [Coffea arabica]